MSESLEPVKPGDPFRPQAKAHNTFLATAQYVEQLRRRMGGVPGKGDRNSTVVLMLNATDADKEQFSILGIDRPGPTSEDMERFLAGPWAVGVAPDPAEHEAAFGVLQMPSACLEAVPAVIRGLTVCKLKVEESDGEDWKYATLDESSYEYLRLAQTGSARVIWREEGTGIVWAWVCLGDHPGSDTETVYFELLEPYAKYDSTPAEAYQRFRDEDTGDIVTDCEADHVWVQDLSGEGWTGAAGAVGHGIPVVVTSGDHSTIIEIHGLQCAPDVTGSCG